MGVPLGIVLMLLLCRRSIILGMTGKIETQATRTPSREGQSVGKLIPARFRSSSIPSELLPGSMYVRTLGLMYDCVESTDVR